MIQASVTPRTSYSFLIDGSWISEGDPVEIHSPYDHSVVGVTYRASRAQLEQAAQAAARAFQIIRKLPAHERQRILRTVADGIAGRKEEFARVIALEAGKPIKTARQEVDRATLTFSVAAEESTRIYGEYMPLDITASTTGRCGLLRRFPLGPVAAITPFNFPLNLVAHKVAAAIAAGCTMVLKPAPQTPISALLLAQLIQEAGWPDGAINVVYLSNEDASALVTDERFKLLSFTGSSAVGWQLKSQAGKKRVALELGGNAGCIVHKDADVAYAAGRCVAGGFSYAGQSCISVQRIFVHGDVYSTFTDALVAGAKKLTTGDPLDEATDVGPLIRESDAIRAHEWVQEAVQAGAKLLCGGARKGSLLEPTVLTATKSNMRVNCQEVFAPVITVEPYDQFGDALKEVNDSPYGLQAGLFTNDSRLIFQAFEELEVGGVIAGDIPSWRVDNMPYGGVKNSGTGREGLRFAIEEMTERKLLVMNLK